MVYSTDSAKWKAYQFGDPFATGVFYVCNKVSKLFCRPDCDARPVTNLKLEIKYVNTPSEAMANGYIACNHCDPMSSPSVDTNLLVKCVATINDLIGFLPPLLDENEEKNDQTIKENIMETKKTNKELILQTINGRRLSYPGVNLNSALKDYDSSSLSKNDSDHYRLVDLACRHLALAAAINIFAPPPKSPRSPEDSKGKRRRRGGVLGFKELAAKSKLSAWHFHRVFKSVTGLTPKTYGDKCWEYLKKCKDEQSTLTPASSTHSSAFDFNDRHSSSLSSTPGDEPSPKRVKIDSVSPDVMHAPLPLDIGDFGSHMSPGTFVNDKPINVMPQSNFDFNFLMGNEPLPMMDGYETPNYVKSLSVPDLTKYNNQPSTLFTHTKQNTASSSTSNLPMTLAQPTDPMAMPFIPDVTENAAFPTSVMSDFVDKPADPVVDELYNLPLNLDLEGGLELAPEIISTPAL